MSNSGLDIPRRWEAVNESISDFHEHLSSGVPPLRFVLGCDSVWSNAEYKRLRPRGFLTKLRGVYLVYDDAERLHYIGVATTCYGKRVWKHDNVIQRRFIDIIPIDDRHIFLALALEYFLILRFKPPGNTVYRSQMLPIQCYDALQ